MIKSCLFPFISMLLLIISAGCDDTQTAPLISPNAEKVIIAAELPAIPDAEDVTIAAELPAIPDAENAIFTTDGRLFVTGGVNAYQIKQDKDGNFTRTSLYDGIGEFTGIVQRGDYIYTVALIATDSGFKVSLFDGKLPSLIDSDAVPTLREIYQLKHVFLQNGIAFDNAGVLYIADTLGARIVTATITYDTNNIPMVTETIWLKADLCTNILTPNGISIVGSTLYFTDLNSVKSVAINPDGSPGKIKVIYTKYISDLDDPTYFNNGLLVPDYLGGGIMYISLDGTTKKKVLQLGSLSGPSSIIQGEPPMFSKDEFIVTEKGILYDLYSHFGNRLRVVKLDL